MKTVVVTKDVQADDSIRDGIDQTLYFGLWNDAADVQDYVRINENGQISYDKNDPVWVQTIEVVGGVPQGSAAFAGIDEGEYAVSELDKDRIDANDDDLRMQFGTPIEENSPIAIVKIETTHGESDDNDATIDKDTWTDRVKVVNYYEKTVDSLNLTISKAIPQYYNAGEKANAAAVFKVTVYGEKAGAAEAAEGADSAQSTPLYENYFSLLFDAAGGQSTEPIEIGNVEGAKTLVVEEVYSAGYDAAAADGEGAVRTIDLTDAALDTSQPIEVTFTNTYNDHTVFGSGIINRYHNKVYVDPDAPVPQEQ